MKPLFSLLAMATLIFASLWAIIHPWFSHRLSKTLAKLALSHRLNRGFDRE